MCFITFHGDDDCDLKCEMCLVAALEFVQKPLE